MPLNALCINSIINIRCTRCCIFKPSCFMLLLSYSYFIAVPHWIASLMRHIGTINQYFRNSSHVLLLMLHVCNQGLTKKFLNNCQAKNLIWLTIMYLVFYISNWYYDRKTLIYTPSNPKMDNLALQNILWKRYLVTNCFKLSRNAKLNENKNFFSDKWEIER